ncbi:hypothetical protein KHA80_22380 [Anaerobacillus sp. HL2]|nr:hypothetical protein KHA80_22380 [Anaerobacillus sp. HL2]
MLFDQTHITNIPMAKSNVAMVNFCNYWRNDAIGITMAPNYYDRHILKCITDYGPNHCVNIEERTTKGKQNVPDNFVDQ